MLAPGCGRHHDKLATMAGRRTRRATLDATSAALIPLRPLTIGEVMDAAFLVIRRNARSMLGLPLAMTSALAAYVTVCVLALWALGENTDATVAVVVGILLGMLGMLVFIGLVVWISGLMTRASLQTVMGEGFAPPTPMTMKSALAWIGPMLVLALLVGTYLSVGQGVGSLVFSVLLTGIGLIGVADPVSTVVLLLLMMVIGTLITAWTYSFVSLAIPIYAAEGKLAPDWIGKGRFPPNPLTAVLRSFRLVGWRGSFRVMLALAGALLGTYLIATFVYVGLLMIVILFATSLRLDVFTEASSPFWGWMYAVSVLLTLSVFVAYFAALQTILYLDLRMRREGMDLALRFEVVSVPDPNFRGVG